MFVDLPQPLIDAAWRALQMVLEILVPAITTWVLVQAVSVAADIWRQVRESKIWTEYHLDEACTYGVQAAEAAGLTGALKALLVQKKDYALAIAGAYLKDHGYKINADVLAAGIEKVWLEKYGQDKLKAAADAKAALIPPPAAPVP